MQIYFLFVRIAEHIRVFVKGAKVTSWKIAKIPHAIIVWGSILGIMIVVAIIAGALMFHNSNELSHIESKYIIFINNLDCADGYPDYPYSDYLRFALGYINDDDIPELMVCYGTAHVDQVQVYSYNPQSGTVEDWGSFSSFGTFDYYERQGVVVGQYGGTGFWYHVYVQLGTPEIGNVLAVEGNYVAAEDCTYCYWQSPYNGTIDALWNDLDFDSILVSEEEYTNNIRDFLVNYTDEVTIGYDDMTAYTEESFHVAFQSLG